MMVKNRSLLLLGAILMITSIGFIIYFAIDGESEGLTDEGVPYALLAFFFGYLIAGLGGFFKKGFKAFRKEKD